MKRTRRCRKLLRSLETLLREVDQYRDPAASAHTYRIVEALLEAHGYVFERLFEHVEASGISRRRALDAIRRDDAVNSLFMLHGIQPCWDNHGVAPARCELAAANCG